MQYKYSKSTNGFHEVSINGENIPQDSVDITDEYRLELINGQYDGKLISADESGYPILIDRPAQPIAHATCSPWQIRKALNNEGLRDTVENVVAASSDISIKDGWEFATEFRSNDPFVLQIGVLIGKDEEQTRIFIQQASTL